MPTAWTTPRTWTPYEPVTRNLLNSYVRNQFLSVSFLSTRFVTSDTTLAAVTLNLPTSTEAVNCEIVVMGRTEGAAGGLRMRANNSSAGYFWTAHFLSTVTASTVTGVAGDTSWNAGSLAITDANNAAMNKILLHGYAGAAKFKSYQSQAVRFNSTTSTAVQVFFLAGTWNDTTPIATITFTDGSGANFSAGTEFSVYGLP